MRKNHLKRGMAVLLSAAMAATMLAGCGGGDAETDANANNDNNAEANNDNQADNDADADAANDDVEDTSAADNADAPAGDYTDYSAGFPENVTIQIPVYDRAFEGWNVTDNYYTQWVQKEFGDKYNVTVEYVAIGRTTEVADYMQMIAAGTAPDIIMHYDMPQAVNYYGEGALQPLDLDEIAYYAPTYYSKLADTIATYGSLDGQNMFFFAERNAIYYNWVTLIRQDWLDQVGAAMPTNLDELEEVGRKWKEAGLGTLGALLVQNSFTYMYPYFDDSISTEDYAKYLDLNVAPFTWKPTEDYLRRLNAQYNEGILDQNFYLKDEDAKWKAAFVAGEVGTYSFYINSSTDVITSLLANDANAKVSVMDTGAGSPSGKAYYYEYPPYGMIMGINSTTSDEERAAVWMFLDWMIQPENLTFFQNGPEGEAYELVDGVPTAKADYEGEAKRSQNNNKDYWCLVQEVVDLGDEELNYKANLATLAPAGYEDLIKASYDYNVAQADNGIVTPIFTKVIAASSDNAEALKADWKEFCVDCITCKPDEFDAKYAEHCQTYLDDGYQAILDEKTAAFSAGDYIAN